MTITPNSHRGTAAALPPAAHLTADPATTNPEPVLRADPNSSTQDLPVGVRSWQVAGWAIRHLRSPKRDGWAQDEGDCVTQTVISWVVLYDKKTMANTGYRLILGRHSIWFFR